MQKEVLGSSEYEDGFKVYADKPKEAGILRKIFFNAIGFLAGHYIGSIAVVIMTYILIDFLGQFEFLTAFLSWPVEYETYALTGIIFADAAVSLNICRFVSAWGKAKQNYSCYALAGMRILSYINAAISAVVQNGFNFSFIWTLIISLIGFAYFGFATAVSEEE